MKTNYRQKNNFSHSYVAKKSVTLPILFAILFILIFSIPFVRGWLFDLANPIWNVRNTFVNSLADDVLLLQSKQSLIDQNEKLQTELAQNGEDLALAQVLRGENADLKEILNRKDSNQKQILAAILNKPFFSPYDTLSIDAGTAEGVVASDTVYALGDIPVGFVSFVSVHTAKVILYSAPGQQTNVLIGTDHVEKQAVGQGGGNFIVEMPRESSIAVGDSVVIPSISPNVFATVSAIQFTETDSFQKVRFTMPVNIAELQWVELAASTSTAQK